MVNFNLLAKSSSLFNGCQSTVEIFLNKIKLLLGWIFCNLLIIL